jgi:tetratricopeptide (TPR) repeat protein
MPKKKRTPDRIEKIKKINNKSKVAEVLKVLTKNDVAGLNDLGIKLSENGEFDKALLAFDLIFQIKPDYYLAWFNRGITLSKLGKFDEALASFDEALKIKKDLHEAWNNRGVVLSNLGKFNEAIASYDESLKIKKDFYLAWNNKGKIYYDLGRYEEAKASFDRVLKIKKDFPEAWFNRGTLQNEIGKYKGAIISFDNALKLKKDYWEAWYKRGNALVLLNKEKKAIASYDKALKINKDYYEAWFIRGSLLSALGKHNETIFSYDKALKIKKDFHEAWYNRGNALYDLGRKEEAIASYDKVTRINPDDADAYFNKGYIFIDLHDYEKAIVEFQKAEELFKDKGNELNAKRACKLKELAYNALELENRIKPIDDRFMTCMKSESLKKLKTNCDLISTDIESIMDDFKEKKLPDDAKTLLESKRICYMALSDALNFKKNAENKLEDARKNFKRLGLKEHAKTVSHLHLFIQSLEDYDSLEGISKEDENSFLLSLIDFSVLDGDLTDRIKNEIKGGEPFPSKPSASASLSDEREPLVIVKDIEPTIIDKVRFCLVQMDNELKHLPHKREFGYVLTGDKKEIRKKVFSALKIAKNKSVNIICFPELSFEKKWINEIAERYKDMIIVGGSFYDDEYNVCPIIVNGAITLYQKHQPSSFETKGPTGRGMKSGKILYIFQTKYGCFSVLTCCDYSYRIESVVMNKYKKKIDFVLNPCRDYNIERFQPRCNVDCQDRDIDIIQVNKSTNKKKKDYGKSCIIGKEHDAILFILKRDKFKPEDEIKYKLVELQGERMVIADFDIRYKPPVDLPIGYKGRIVLNNKEIDRIFEYDSKKKNWIPCNKCY